MTAVAMGGGEDCLAKRAVRVSPGASDMWAAISKVQRRWVKERAAKSAWGGGGGKDGGEAAARRWAVSDEAASDAEALRARRRASCDVARGRA